MFDRIIRVCSRVFGRYKRRDMPPAGSDFLRPKDEPAKAPGPAAEGAASERKGLPAATIQEKPPVILLPSVSPAPAVAGKPIEEAKPPVVLPPDVDPDRVAVVKHEEKKADGERFRYTDKPLKPLNAENRKPELFKYTDKKAGVVVKNEASPAMAGPKANGRERKGPEIFKYSPSRVEIKS